MILMKPKTRSRERQYPKYQERWAMTKFHRNWVCSGPGLHLPLATSCPWTRPWRSSAHDAASWCGQKPLQSLVLMAHFLFPWCLRLQLFMRSSRHIDCVKLIPVSWRCPLRWEQYHRWSFFFSLTRCLKSRRRKVAFLTQAPGVRQVLRNTPLITSRLELMVHKKQ